MRSFTTEQETPTGNPYLTLMQQIIQTRAKLDRIDELVEEELVEMLTRRYPGEDPSVLMRNEQIRPVIESIREKLLVEIPRELQIRLKNLEELQESRAL